MKKLLIFVFIFCTFNLFACSCFGKSGLKSNDDVFIGKVKQIEIENGIKYVTVKVKKVFKGSMDKGEVLTITTNLTGSSCGFNFRKNLTYAIYSNNKFVNLCSRTRILIPLEKYFYRAKKDKYYF
jgi:hypothetical protein